MAGGRSGVCRVLQLQEELASLHFCPLGERQEKATLMEVRWPPEGRAAKQRARPPHGGVSFPAQARHNPFVCWACCGEDPTSRPHPCRLP